MTAMERLQDDLSTAADTLQTVAEAVDAPYPHWITGDDGGDYWCADCANKRIVNLSAEGAPGEFYFDGGWDVETSDFCIHCDGCDRVLAYSLTCEGVKEEVWHFEAHPPAEVTPGVAYHLVRMLEAAATECEADPGLMARAAAIGRDAVSRLIEAEGTAEDAARMARIDDEHLADVEASGGKARRDEPGDAPDPGNPYGPFQPRRTRTCSPPPP